MRTLRSGAISAIAGLAAVVAGVSLNAAAADAPKRIMAMNGAVVVMPEIEGMDCTQMAEVLRRIDLSGDLLAQIPAQEPEPTA